MCYRLVMVMSARPATLFPSERAPYLSALHGGHEITAAAAGSLDIVPHTADAAFQAPVTV